MSIEKTLNSAKDIIATLLKLRDDPSIKGIILHMNCSGGIPGTSQAIGSEIKKIKKIKPVIVVVENKCTSAAYNIACASDFIFALPSSIVGSIGVVTILETYKDREFHDDKFSGKVDTIVFTNGTYKYPSMYTTPNDEQLAFYKEIGKKMYRQFINDVAQTRGISLEDEKLWGDGKEIVGIDALELGLIDALGDFSDGVEKITELLKERGFSSPTPLPIINVGSF